MIQELLSAVVEERKFSFPGGGGGLLSDAPSPFLSSASVAASPSPSAASEAPQEKLRCPRCDSSNTKFCYYNNYNLTQPRHFCKTCRRYWTKGGALRNVPIGGGCRKAKPAPTIAPGCKLGGGSKPNKPITSLDAIARAGFGLEPELFQPSPILWATPPPPHTSHLLALLRAGGGGGLRNFDHNPLHSLNSFRIKEERMESEPAGCGLGQQGPSYDPLGQLSSPAGMGSLWRNEGQLQYLQLPENNALFGDVAVGIQELYQRLRPQAGTMVLTNYSGDQSSMSSGYGPAVGCSSSTTSAAMVSNIGGGGGEGGVAAVTAPIMPAIAPAMGSEFGYWTPALSWSDMSGTN